MSIFMILIHKQMHNYLHVFSFYTYYFKSWKKKYNIELNAEHNLYELSKDVWINSVIDFMFLGCV